MAHERIHLGISALSTRRAGAFDGGHKRDPFLVESLGQVVDWVPVCPKVESGWTRRVSLCGWYRKLHGAATPAGQCTTVMGLPATCGRIQSAMARSIERAQSSVFRGQGRSLGRVRDPNADDHWGRIAGCRSPPVGSLAGAAGVRTRGLSPRVDLAAMRSRKVSCERRTSVGQLAQQIRRESTQSRR